MMQMPIFLLSQATFLIEDTKLWQSSAGAVVPPYGLFEIWRFQSERYLTLKVGNCDYQDMNAASHEARIESLIAQANPYHDGRNYLQTFIENLRKGARLVRIYA
ncbi:uncharacterized protein N7518_001339 [Penicillium psychrosexuale]|uniref:uncharacterized protein n=1 Tax=Penicillium psychrosexuale TaxID=1002107 RepID=UPI002544FDA8|nr:uncharacterized protein N7518_001339 [Penicillium psychrosexuale]KAJ5799271.1 hypothetical protein N7518_001339 [Penicillium psychrosexuale]